MNNHRLNHTLLVIGLMTLLLSSCSGFSSTPTPQQPSTPTPTPAPLLQAEVVFQVDIPRESKGQQDVFIDILDEVTGLALNPKHYILEQLDQFQYATRVSIPIGSVVKYRYGREGTPPSVEYTPGGKQVRYRMLRVTGPMVAEDIVSGWTDLPFKGSFGRISGQVLDAKTNLPIPNMMVAAGGAHTYTASNGRYLIEGLPAGTHRIVAYSLDGAYEVYQQGARVAVDSETPASFKLNPATFVKVTFLAKAPQGSVKGIPVRIVGNIYSLGNTFSDLGGGISTIAARAPLMTLLPDGRYSLSISLPAGCDIRYKYSLGDGFWNSEHALNGQFRIRQLIVPNQDLVIEDTIETWQMPNTAPVSFTVKVPANTPTSDTISIQFNPYGWTEPIPMWPLGNNQWMYVLYSPLSIVGSVGYRYCRNDQCGVADDEATKGENNTGLIFTPSRLTQNLQDEVKKWAWWQPPSASTTVVTPNIQGRGSKFMTGIELSSNYQPRWQSKWNLAYQNIKELSANWMIMTPTWSMTRQNPPVMEAVPGKDPLWHDLIQMAHWAQESGLKYAIYPTTSGLNQEWWKSAARDAGWWQTWFDRYEVYLTNFADLAAETKATALILGDPGILPAITGQLSEGPSAGSTGDLTARWKKIISNIRTHFKGSIYWAIAFPQGAKTLPVFIEDLDAVYILWMAQLELASTANESDMISAFSKVFDQDLLKIKEATKKPMLVGINYPSVDGSAKGCVIIGTACRGFEILSQPFEDQSLLQLDFIEQVRLYNAFLTVINQRKWIDGFVSRGYYPPAAIHDKSASIHGKPAADVLWYWYPRLQAAP